MLRGGHRRREMGLSRGFLVGMLLGVKGEEDA